MSAIEDARLALAESDLAAEVGWPVTWAEVRNLQAAIHGLIAELENKTKEEQ